MDYIGGLDANVPFTFIREGAPFIPDVGTVTFTVLNHVGVAIAGLTDVPVTTTTTTFQFNVHIPAVNNDIDVLKSFERRTIVVSYQKDGVYERDVLGYRVIPVAHYSVEPKDIRSFIGLQDKELGDEDIDLFASYLYVQKDLGTSYSLDSLLVSGTTQELAANEMIRMRGVLDVLPSVRQRISQEETNGVTGFKRLTIKDFDAIEAVALGRYAAALSETVISTETATTLVLFTEDADPITGA